jgi:hypothetical protein
VLPPLPPLLLLRLLRWPSCRNNLPLGLLQLGRNLLQRAALEVNAAVVAPPAVWEAAPGSSRHVTLQAAQQQACNHARRRRRTTWR